MVPATPGCQALRYGSTSLGYSGLGKPMNPRSRVRVRLVEHLETTSKCSTSEAPADGHARATQRRVPAASDDASRAAPSSSMFERGGNHVDCGDSLPWLPWTG